MPRLLVLGLSLVSVVCLQSCATTPAPKFELVRGLVTTGGEAKFEEIAVTEVPLKSRAIVIVHLRWSPATVSAGRHAVSWLWYSGDQLVHASKKTFEFKTSPYRLWSYLSASGLGLGHYRVLLVIDNQTIDTQQFDVVP